MNPNESPSTSSAEKKEEKQDKNLMSETLRTQGKATLQGQAALSPSDVQIALDFVWNRLPIPVSGALNKETFAHGFRFGWHAQEARQQSRNASAQTLSASKEGE